MKFLVVGNKLYLLSLFLVLLFNTKVKGTEESLKNVAVEVEEKKEESRSTGKIANPILGNMWGQASRIAGKGVHLLRERLQEGVKVAQMFREDVGEGLETIKRREKNLPTDPESEVNSTGGEFKQEYKQLLREGVLGGILRFMGFNENRLGVIALNVLIFFAEMITSSLIGKDSNVIESRILKSNILEWASSKKLEDIVREARDDKLPDALIESLQARTGNSTSCVQLLICKLTPVIWSAQKALGSTEGRAFATNNLLNSFTTNLPSKKTFMDFGEACEKKFPKCSLINFTSPKK